MHKLSLFRSHLLGVIGVVSFCGLVTASIVPPTVDASTLLSLINDTKSVYSQALNSYAPYYTICTSKSLVRTANYQSINAQENEYVSERKKQIREPLSKIMTSSDFNNLTVLLDECPIVIGISVSGGGYRSMLSGAGVLSAFDSRTPGSEIHLGGILQSSIYIAGNSGGLWLVANNLLNDGMPIYEAFKRQNFASPLIEGIPDVPISQLRATLDAQSLGDHNASVWESYSMIFNQSNPEKGTLVSTLLDTFFKTKEINTASNDTASRGRKSLDFYKDLNIEVRAKKKAGFQVSLIDYWGRAVSKKIFPQGKKSLDICMSSVSELSSFRNFSQLFPIFGSVERLPGKTELSCDSHLFEFNPFEFGSWDSFLNSFVDIRFLGSELINGSSTIKTKNEDYSVCLSGYDNMGLITGTSSGLFNTVFQYVYKMILQMEELCSSILSMLLRIFGITSHPKPNDFVHPEYALYSPNPFKGVIAPATMGRQISNAQSLLLADGGDDGQNIPFHPMLVKGRKVEVLFAFDATSDLENFPNGTTLKHTAGRYHSLNSSLRLPVFLFDGEKHRIFPKVPTQKAFVNENLGSHPIFLGCDVSRDFPIVDQFLTANLSSNADDHENGLSNETFRLQENPRAQQEFEIWENYLPPLIIYFGNYNHSYASNTSTFRSIYSDSEVNAMIENGYNVATHNNDTEYIYCVKCALMKRRMDLSEEWSRYKSGCESCFQKFCYVSPD
ncbi:FabD/lysophospholipase-like protein [Metschnikowia bicuspidata var. bicuspidata NRRL YB-4993]|uniref:Lysophospholipase n=1 Tax=Metschnikowia bicuspidata var. bicuspidata NRRL YB-4993 TaxID=869754 RepID=A0A1A0H7T5_9ASCO|nr:FabD/lysophospholipase-like protein [Metschnikowia bicuspidata var. bicuspidata NRRL YB-4993]OBA20086.1 FabD/lysophospholipase-like protein [Metschnikowia bicuspidata var. bicuspidata NRRL YB-4993]